MFPIDVVRAIDAGTKRKMIGGSVAATIMAASLVMMIGFFGGVFTPYRLPNYNGELVGGSLLSFNGSITNSFGTYIPYSEDFIPNAPVYTVSPGLVNIINLNQFSYLTANELALIEANGFIVRPQNEFDQIYEILEDNKDSYIPNFITSDAVLHAFHVCYDLALREAEVYSFWDLLGSLTQSMLQDSLDQYTSAPAGEWKEAARRNVVYFSVAALLLNNETEVHPDVESDVSYTINLIEEAQDIESDWFMGYREDFTQYIPRGHYTRSETLTKYFLTMMWFGRIQFRLDAQYGVTPTQQAILMTLALTNSIDGLGSGIDGF
ncbi:MAG: DUF3160 domain-containing protein, partial [Candidatus Thorarchaeota archaeon]